ncbi:hypothetical protein BG011_003802 [Mortierella polycephala]|uniref:Serine aminopeptidase S33 domain-containing protein n=1 Tax=Mortierella polycephala TaxID=41804 RepID=A0A9P6U3I3_9FUNG|nr:hypothetical protein BG011_003802 [Mortierella polycephala]
MSKVLPSFQTPIKLSSHFVSRDAQQVAKYDTDSLEITADVSLLICHGTADCLTDYEATKGFFDKCNAKDKEFKSWPEFYHELHNEPEDDRK